MGIIKLNNCSFFGNSKIQSKSNFKIEKIWGNYESGYTELLPPFSEFNHAYGSSLKISDDGNVAIVGDMHNDNYDAGHLGVGTGAAFIYLKNNNIWNYAARLIPSEFGLRFGSSIGISGDNNTIVIGFPGGNGNSFSSGVVYVYHKPENGWIGDIFESAKLMSNQGENSGQFGVSVDISESGNTIIVGSYAGDRRGPAYIFSKPMGGWIGDIFESGQLFPSNIDTEDWDNEEHANGFGSSVIISKDESIILVSDARDDTTTGAVFLYSKPPTGWGGVIFDIKKFTPDSDKNRAGFGRSIAISKDNNIIVIGAEHESLAYIYENKSNIWTITGKIKPYNLNLPHEGNYGYSVSISGNGKVIALGSNIGGIGYIGVVIFAHNGSQWIEIYRIKQPNNSYLGSFGISTSLSYDGNSILIGNIYTNIAYLVSVS